MANTQKRLGRGLSSLISTELSGLPQPAEATGRRDPGSPAAATAATSAARTQSDQGDAVSSGGAAVVAIESIPLGAIRTNPAQPRKQFDDADLASLARSLKERGALQPIVVRRSGTGFELVAGERRLRAAKLAGLDRIPALVRPVRDDEMLELALIENIQRADLGAVERARAYRVLQDRHGLSHDQIAERMGEDRATVANYIRLLGLPAAVLGRIEDKSLNMGQARALLGLADARKQAELAERIVKAGWSVRRVETEVRRFSEGGGNQSAKPAAQTRPAVADVARRLGESLGTKVQIVEGRRRHTGRVVIEYYSLDDFERIVGRLGLPADEA
jgi:ParB family chromosome partitioning protein